MYSCKANVRICAIIYFCQIHVSFQARILSVTASTTQSSHHHLLKKDLKEREKQLPQEDHPLVRGSWSEVSGQSHYPEEERTKLHFTVNNMHEKNTIYPKLCCSVNNLLTQLPHGRSHSSVPVYQQTKPGPCSKKSQLWPLSAHQYVKPSQYNMDTKVHCNSIRIRQQTKPGHYGTDSQVSSDPSVLSI